MHNIWRKYKKEVKGGGITKYKAHIQNIHNFRRYYQKEEKGGVATKYMMLILTYIVQMGIIYCKKPYGMGVASETFKTLVRWSQHLFANSEDSYAQLLMVGLGGVFLLYL